IGRSLLCRAAAAVGGSVDFLRRPPLPLRSEHSHPIAIPHALPVALVLRAARTPPETVRAHPPQFLTHRHRRGHAFPDAAPVRCLCCQTACGASVPRQGHAPCNGSSLPDVLTFCNHNPISC